MFAAQVLCIFCGGGAKEFEGGKHRGGEGEGRRIMWLMWLEEEGMGGLGGSTGCEGCLVSEEKEGEEEEEGWNWG